jgi:hypothetical protein
MKKMLVLGALVLGLAFAGETIAKAQCYPTPVVEVCRAPSYGYRHPYHRVVRQAYFRPAYYHHYGYRP